MVTLVEGMLLALIALLDSVNTNEVPGAQCLKN